MANLPIQQCSDQNFMLMQTKWKAALDPVLALPLSGALLLTGIKVVSGDNVINHKLGRKLIGWIIVGNTGIVLPYDKQASNQHPDLTLILTLGAADTINLLVF